MRFCVNNVNVISYQNDISGYVHSVILGGYVLFEYTLKLNGATSQLGA